jgi:hypothetical protein
MASDFQGIIDRSYTEKEQVYWHQYAKTSFYQMAVRQQREARWRRLNDYLRKDHDEGHT